MIIAIKDLMFTNPDYKYFNILLAFSTVYFAVMLFIDLFSLWGFGFHVLDFGVFHQVAWNNANGYWMESSVNPPYEADASRLRLHFSILLPLITTPIYYLFPGPETMVFIHVFLVTIAAIPIYFAARVICKSDKVACFWAMIYLINPLTLNHALFSIQEISVSAPVMAFALWALFSKNYRALLFCSFLLIIAKEHMGVNVFGLGLLWAYYHKEYKKGLLLAVAGLVAFVAIVFFIMPLFSPIDSHYMLDDSVAHRSYQRYQWVHYPLRNLPDVLMMLVFNEHNAEYANNILLPFGYLPLLFFPFAFPAGADIGLSVLSGFIADKRISLYYAAIPGLVFCITSCYGTEWLSKKFAYAKKIILPIVFISCLTFSAGEMYLRFASLNDVLESNSFNWAYGEKFTALEEFLEDKHDITANAGTGALLSGKKRMLDYNENTRELVDTVVFRIDPRLSSRAPLDIDYKKFPPVHTGELTDKWRGGFATHYKHLEKINALPDMEITYFDFPWVVYEKNAEAKYDKEEVKKEAAIRLERILTEVENQVKN